MNHNRQQATEVIKQREQIRDTFDLVHLIEQHVPLQPLDHLMVGTCPWHEDEINSLLVNPARQSWKCNTCMIGGDLFSWVMQWHECNFHQAQALLATAMQLKKAGVI